MKTIDTGLAYMRLLGIKPVRSFNTAITNFQRIAGSNLTNKLETLFHRRHYSNNDINEHEKLYSIKNTSIESALSFTGDCDGDYLRNICNWIDQHRDLFGKRILEVGCDIGIISCFLAMQFPDSEIIAIDHFEEGIKIAKQLANRFRLTNVSFHCLDVEDCIEQFNTVLSCRTMHENHGTKEIEKDPVVMFNTIEKICYDSVKPYADSLCKLVDNDGILISIERCSVDPVFAGWIDALNENYIDIDLDYYLELSCQELEKLSRFQVLVGKKATKIQVSTDALLNTVFYSPDKLVKGWKAVWSFQKDVKDVIDGHEFYDVSDGAKVGRLILGTDSCTDDQLLFYSHISTDISLERCSILEKEEKQYYMQANVNASTGYGLNAKKIVYDGSEMIIGQKEEQI